MKHFLHFLLLPASLLAADFDREIRPLLQKHCVECHGEKKQKSELRLDAKVFAFKGGHDGPAIVPGKADASPLFRRITSTDDDERMPSKGERLSAAQIAAVKAWIEAGAVWPENATDRAAALDKRSEHWSVQPVRKNFARDASVDSFIHATLKEKGLVMSPAADRRTLIRRLSFDLHGLPPMPERVEKFVNDSDPRAYEKLVDELLASPHYGERWARHWLDIAHYADTHGFERDQLRPNAWRYRDYVIESLNADKPYDRFLREQIAGDVIAPEDAKAVTATGFLAAGPWDFVGQVETKSDMLKRAARAGDLDDMVTQVITATMGITINCARCHDHKLDLITQQEYYGLWSVFAGVKRGERDVSAAETKRIVGERTRINNDLATVRGELARLTGEGLDLADIIGGGNGRGTGVKDRGIDLRHGTFTKEKLGYHRDIAANRLQKIEWPADAKEKPEFVQWVFVPDGRGTVNVAAKQEVKGVPATSGHFWDIVRNGPLNAQRGTKLNGVDYAAKGHSILGMHANSGVTFDLAKIRAASGLAAMRLTGVVGFGAAEDAAATRADFTVFVDAEQRFQKLKLRKDETAALDIAVPADAKTLTLIATDGGDGIGSDLLFIGDARLGPDAGAATLTEAEQRRLKELRAQVAKLDGELKSLPEAPKVYAVVAATNAPVVRVQRRGDPESEGAEVAPGAFTWAGHATAKFGDNVTAEGERRRALAEWIVHPDNPLTRRVIVNRLWHHHFGQGLVSTPSDFGLGGDKPSHPELLDWLAGEFLKSGWSLKHMHKLIVTSAAYRQSSVAAEGTRRAELDGGNRKAETGKNDAAGENLSAFRTPLSGSQSARLLPSAATVDSANRLLWRQNPRRLDAESLHDAVLAVSGKLNLERGGPGFRDFKYTEAYAPIYDYITPDKPELWRRSIYRFIVRTTPHRFMTTLDCPDPANLTPARVNTTTALQALTLSNNEFMLQQARHLATRIENETGSREASIRRAFALAFQREPTAAELQAATPLVTGQGLFALCRMLINANEFVYLD
nr:cytochrome c [Verrucomicrobiota bacterium]